MMANFYLEYYKNQTALFQVTRSVVPFVKTAFPDVSDANDVDLMRQPLCPCKDSIKLVFFICCFFAKL